MELNEYSTPLTDKHLAEYSDPEDMAHHIDHARDLERKLAACHAAMSLVIQYGPRHPMPWHQRLIETLEQTK